MKEDRIFKAYSDESGINIGDRYTSVSVVSGEEDVMDCLRVKLNKALRDENAEEVKFFKIKGFRSRFTRAAIKFIECTVNDFAIYNKIRVDTITTDNESLERYNSDCDSKPDLGWMYYKVLANIVRRWKNTKWGFYADVNSKVNWSEIVSYLNKTRLQKSGERPLLIERMLYENPKFEFSEVEQVNSIEEPLVQLADLFAGMARFSHYSEKYDFNCADWVRRWKSERQGKLMGFVGEEDWKIPRLAECRYRVIGGLVFLCRKHKLYVSIDSKNHLKTWRPKNPINFWDYEER